MAYGDTIPDGFEIHDRVLPDGAVRLRGCAAAWRASRSRSVREPRARSSACPRVSSPSARRPSTRSGAAARATSRSASPACPTTKRACAATRMRAHAPLRVRFASSPRPAGSARSATSRASSASASGASANCSTRRRCVAARVAPSRAHARLPRALRRGRRRSSSGAPFRVLPRPRRARARRRGHDDTEGYRRDRHRCEPRGATVYVTGRSTRTDAPTSYGSIMELSGLARMPGTIDDTAEAVTAEGGRSIAVRCDHTREDDVRASFERVVREQGRVALLVNNAWGGHETFDGIFEAPFWEQSLSHSDSMFDRGCATHVPASRFAAPIMVRAKARPHVTTTFWDGDRHLRGNFSYDLAKATMNRLAFGIAEELRPTRGRASRGRSVRPRQERQGPRRRRSRARGWVHRRRRPSRRGVPPLIVTRPRAGSAPSSSSPRRARRAAR